MHPRLSWALTFFYLGNISHNINPPVFWRTLSFKKLRVFGLDRRLSGRYPDRLWFPSLSMLTASALVMPSLIVGSDALDLSDPRECPGGRLAAFLAADSAQRFLRLAFYFAFAAAFAASFCA